MLRGSNMTNIAKNWQWFPSESVSWQSVSLPKSRGWREALPFAVEEKCADSVEQLRIVPTLQDIDGMRWVAVVSESAWQGWLSQYQDAGTAVCPDVLALPWAEDKGISAVVEGNRVRLRWGQWQGAAGDMAQMTVLLGLLQTQSQQPIQVYAQNKPESWQMWQLNWHPLTSFVPQAPNFDLREGAGRAWFNMRKLAVYRLPLTLSALLIGVWLVSTSLSAWQAQQQAQAIKQQTEAQFTAAFPDIKRRVNPLVQAKSELTRRQAASKEQAASLMSAVQVAQQALNGLPPVQHLTWQQSRLLVSWTEAMSDEQRRRAQVLAPWQLRWTSDYQCEISQGTAQ